ncbi:transferase [Rhodococcoides trifolii]|uniref:Transferase n=1 Tax=Rhodococcoides trifolii TaxID=908250 RepID=A0A917G4P5_9NOCA|nr:acyltransferase [Rhodococcus trifolii]GGG21705.1 transferase [Rhodococcus trifolii]
MGSFRRFWLNTVASNSIWTTRQRSVLYRLGGIECRAVAMYPGLAVYGDAKVTLGRECVINAGCTFDATGPITMAPGSGLAYNCSVLTSTHELGPSEKRYGPVVVGRVDIGRGVWVGANVTIFPNVTIGAGSVIGAGSLVTKDVPPNSLVMGVPGKVVRTLD